MPEEHDAFHPPHSLLLLLIFVTAALGTSGARAEIRSLDLECWTKVGGGNSWDPLTGYADRKYEATSTGSNEIFSHGWEFTEDADDEILCRINVPADYDTASDYEPSLRITGWSTADELCELVPGSRSVIFGVSTRPYSNADSASQAWPADNTGTITLPCDTNACGGFDCNQDDIVYMTEPDATDNVQDWTQNDLLLVRVRRLGTSDTSAKPFHVVTVTLKYDSID